MYKACETDGLDYICKPCSSTCPVGTYVSNRCSGKGVTDTGCSICRSFCTEGRPGIYQAHGQYISGGRCDGSGTGDIQKCQDCRQCPAGYYPTGHCDGRSFSDTVQCTQCITSCPAGQYLKGDCRVEEVKCVACDPPCANVSQFLAETRACTGGLNRVCEPTTKCKEPSCPAGFYEAFPCSDQNGPKYCVPCTKCSAGEYQSRACNSSQNSICSSCTSECTSDASRYVGIVGSCASGTDTSDAVSCVGASAAGSVLPKIGVGAACGANEWYSGQRTPVMPGAKAPSTDILQSDFSPWSMNRIVYLSIVGSTSETRQTWITVFARNGSSSNKYHSLLASMGPRPTYFQRLDYYGSQRSDAAYPVASSTEWNAVDVMLSYDEESIYIFFSHVFDFIASCQLPALPQQNSTAATTITNCSYLSPAVYNPSQFWADAGVTGSTFIYRGCVRMFPIPFLACLYDVAGARSVMYAVDESPVPSQRGQKYVLDNYTMGYARDGELVGKPKSPPAWDPETNTVYFLADVSSGAGMGLRYVQLNMQYMEASATWKMAGILKSGILWRGSASDSPGGYHSLVSMRSSPTVVALVAACSAPTSCPQDLSMVSFTGTMALSSDRTAIPTVGSDIRDMGVVMGMLQDPAYYKSVVVGQQLYMLSSADRQWGMWTQCAPCPPNSFSPAGSGAYSTPGINVCKCSDNYYGVIRRPVVDSCSACRIPMPSPNNSNASVSPSPSYACDAGQYKTNIPCRTTNADRTVDTTCAACRQSCSPGDASTRFPGEYISSTCNGTGYEPSVGCTQCATRCPSDDQYMQYDVVCTGKDTWDTRPSQACVACTSRCPEGAYVSNRCLRINSPTSNTASCASCASCANGQYISTVCNGSTFYDTRVCTSCRYKSPTNNASLALLQCPTGSFIINECLSGTQTADASNCTRCNSNCRAANYTAGENGQYISTLCTFLPGSTSDNACSPCSGRCKPFAATSPPAGEYILGFCTGQTQFDRQCAGCRIACAPGQYIAGPACNGESPFDTTYCAPCTPKPTDGKAYYTPNSCALGNTRANQTWIQCALSCPAGQYVSKDCTDTAPAECSACKTSCPAGYYMQGECDGTTKSDTIQCVKCRDCASGQYRTNVQACSGSTRVDPVSCAACRTSCAPGQYVFALCTGTMAFDDTSCKVRAKTLVKGSLSSRICHTHPQETLHIDSTAGHTP